MFIETGFMFNDIDSKEFGIQIIRTDSGMIETPWGIKRQIIEEQTNHSIPFFYGVTEEPLVIKIKICKTNNGKWNAKERREIISWLFRKEYSVLLSYDDPDIAYYAIVANGDVTRFDNSLQEGFAEITFRCNSSYGYSYPKNHIYYPSSIIHNNINNSIITVENKSNVVDYYKPILRFEMLEIGDLEIKNMTVGGEIFKFTGLQESEIIYIDNDKKIIQSSLESSGVYRYSNFNKKWLRLIRGKNRLKISGSINMELIMQFPMSAS